MNVNWFKQPVGRMRHPFSNDAFPATAFDKLRNLGFDPRLKPQKPRLVRVAGPVPANDLSGGLKIRLFVDVNARL
jgi:hypothetical protein